MGPLAVWLAVQDEQGHPSQVIAHMPHAHEMVEAHDRKYRAKHSKQIGDTLTSRAK